MRRGWVNAGTIQYLTINTIFPGFQDCKKQLHFNRITLQSTRDLSRGTWRTIIFALGWGWKCNDVRPGFPSKLWNLLTVCIWENFFLSVIFSRDAAQRVSCLPPHKQNLLFVLGKHILALGYFCQLALYIGIIYIYIVTSET